MLLERIKAVCKAKGMTMRELAEMAGIGETTMYKWAEYTPSVDKVKKIADILEVNIETLLDDDVATENDIDYLKRNDIKMLLRKSAKLKASDIALLTQMAERMANELRPEE